MARNDNIRKLKRRVTNSGEQSGTVTASDEYITCKKFRTLKFRTFYFGRLIFGHFLPHFGQFLDKNFGHCAETCLLSKLGLKLKLIYDDHELD